MAEMVAKVSTAREAKLVPSRRLIEVVGGLWCLSLSIARTRLTPLPTPALIANGRSHRLSSSVSCKLFFKLVDSITKIDHVILTIFQTVGILTRYASHQTSENVGRKILNTQARYFRFYSPLTQALTLRQSVAICCHENHSQPSTQSSQHTAVLASLHL